MFPKDRINITIFTDGSCSVKSQKKLGGFGVYLPYPNGTEIFLRRGYFNTTISRMEMMAVLSAIKMVDKDVYTNVHIYSDSKFVVDSFKQGWLAKWRLSGLKGVKNADIWKEILREIDLRRKMVFGISHINGHGKDLTNDIVYGNACADALADFESQDIYCQDLPLQGFSWFYHEGSDSIFVEKTDRYEEMNSIGDVLILGDCLYANQEELLERIKGTFLMNLFEQGVLDIQYEIEKI